MIINKVRISDNFTLELRVTSTAKAHGKFCDKSVETDSIINTELDALKIKLGQYIDSIADKVGGYGETDHL